MIYPKDVDLRWVSRELSRRSLKDPIIQAGVSRILRGEDVLEVLGTVVVTLSKENERLRDRLVRKMEVEGPRVVYLPPDEKAGPK